MNHNFKIQKRLHIVLKNKWSITVLDTFIHHIDAVPSHTVIYLGEFSTSQDEIFRLVEVIKTVFVSGDGVQIFYESGAELLITRVRA